jgi:hypothetical protein
MDKPKHTMTIYTFQKNNHQVFSFSRIQIFFAGPVIDDGAGLFEKSFANGLQI